MNHLQTKICVLTRRSIIKPLLHIAPCDNTRLYIFLYVSSSHCTISTYDRPCGTAGFDSPRRTCLSHKYFVTECHENDILDDETRSKMQNRHKGIIVNHKGIGNIMLPGDYAIKADKRTSAKRKVRAEHKFGYFWMLKDLQVTDNKTIHSNREIIPVEIAKIFPQLSDRLLTTLLGESVCIPDFFLRNNRVMDERAQCTLVAIHYNDHGYKLLPSWTTPFRNEFATKGTTLTRAPIVTLSINEGFVLRFFRHFIRKSLRTMVSADHLSSTVTYFGECDDFRDVLRMHNNKTCYIFLLDGLARVRFAGSGSASSEEVRNVISFAKKLTPALQNASSIIMKSKLSHRKNSNGFMKKFL